LIGAKQADFVRNGFADERGESIRGHVRDYTRNNIALAANGAWPLHQQLLESIGVVRLAMGRFAFCTLFAHL
jgi:hypothetical protein